jgi:hypothetical protein
MIQIDNLIHFKFSDVNLIFSLKTDNYEIEASYVNQHSNPGADPGGDPGTDPGGDPGTEPGAEPGADPNLSNSRSCKSLLTLLSVLVFKYQFSLAQNI